jgi:hypothetical protein
MGQFSVLISEVSTEVKIHIMVLHVMTLCCYHEDKGSILLWNVGFEVLTKVVMKNCVFWDMTLCSPLRVNQRFRETCHLYLQGWRLRHTRNLYEAGSKRSLFFEMLILVMWLGLIITWDAPKQALRPLPALLCAHDLVRTLKELWP